MWERIRRILTKHKAFFAYGLISCFVTLVDVAISKISELFLIPVAANTLGVVTGFVLQYFLTARHVYNIRNGKSFAVFFVTFLIGLAAADGIVYFFRTVLFQGAGGTVAFLVSKGFSIVIPFFLTYFLRKKFMPVKKEDQHS